MDQQTKRKITSMWGSICPEEFQSIIPSTLFTNAAGKDDYSGRLIYPRFSIKNNPDMRNFRQVDRIPSRIHPVPRSITSSKRYDPAPRERFTDNVNSYQAINKLFQFMISSKDKIILVKQTPIYEIPKNYAFTFSNPSSSSNSIPHYTIIGGDIIGISKKGVLFCFIFSNSDKSYSSTTRSYDSAGKPSHILKNIDIYNLGYNSKSISKNFIKNVLEVYIDNAIYNTQNLIYFQSDVISGHTPSYSAYIDPQIRFGEFVDTLIVLIYAYMHSRGSDTQQQIMTCRQADKQQSLRIIEKITENLNEFTRYHQELKKNRQQYLKSMNQKTSQVLKAPIQMLNKSFGTHLKQFTQSHQKLSMKQEQSVKKLLQIIQRIKQPLPQPTQKQQKSTPVQQGYFEKQQSRLKEIQNELKRRETTIQQQKNRLIELPEYLTDVAGDLGILIDPVIASDGFTYSRITAQNIIRNRLNGRAGERIRIVGTNHDIKKALADFNSKYVLVNDNKYKKR